MHSSPCPRAARRPTTGGFTLVEIVIVVVIIGLLAALAVPALHRARFPSRQAAFFNDLRIAKDACETYALEHGGWPPDGNAGIPPEMDEYLPPARWSSRTPIGGRGDWVQGQYGVTAGLSVRLPLQTGQGMTRIDGKIDDGNLDTGQFRRRSLGFINVLEF